jgi:hypothetical protein
MTAEVKAECLSTSIKKKGLNQEQLEVLQDCTREKYSRYDDEETF